MKAFLAILGIVVVAVLGYQAEPSMRLQLTGHDPAGSNKPATAESPDSATGAPAAAPAPLPPAVAVTPPTATPFPVPVPEPVVTPTPVPESDPTALPPVPQVEPTPAGDSVTPDEVVTPDVTPEVTPTEVLKPDVVPGPEEVHPAPPVTPPPPPVDVVALMKEHVQAGSLKDFTYKQVQGWKAGPDEVIDGETYQTGLARYTAETVIGNRPIDVKALIQNGAVVKWVYSNSGLEVK